LVTRGSYNYKAGIITFDANGYGTADWGSLTNLDHITVTNTPSASSVSVAIYDTTDIPASFSELYGLYALGFGSAYYSATQTSHTLGWNGESRTGQYLVRVNVDGTTKVKVVSLTHGVGTVDGRL
jgi:hypothetical protein